MAGFFKMISGIPSRVYSLNVVFVLQLSKCFSFEQTRWQFKYEIVDQIVHEKQ